MSRAITPRSTQAPARETIRPRPLDLSEVDKWLERSEEVLKEYEAQRDQSIADVVSQPDLLKKVHEHYMGTDSRYRESFNERLNEYLGGNKG